MSYPLLEKIANHLTMAGLLDGIQVKYYRFLDEDIKGKSDIAVFRMAGTSGTRNSVVQQPDVRIIFIAQPKNIVAMNNKVDAIFANIAGLEKPVGVLKIEPLGTVIGAHYLENGRVVFEINLRCFVQDM